MPQGKSEMGKTAAQSVHRMLQKRLRIEAVAMAAPAAAAAPKAAAEVSVIRLSGSVD